VDSTETAWLTLGVAILRRLQLLRDAKVPNHKLVDFEPPDSGATDRQLTDGEGADGQRTDGDGG